MDHCVLSAEMLVKRFGAVTVADNLSVTLGHAEALGVIGPNGAGKSSFFNLLSGNIRADSGRILLEGRDVTNASPNERAIAGIGRTYQIPRPFSQLTVFENLLVGAFFGARMDARRAQQHCYETLALTGLLRHADKPAAALSLLERKRLELARALATRPKVLLLDEIAGGLTEGEAAELVATIQSIHAHRHHLDRARRACAPGGCLPADGAELRQEAHGRRAVGCDEQRRGAGCVSGYRGGSPCLAFMNSMRTTVTFRHCSP